MLNSDVVFDESMVQKCSFLWKLAAQSSELSEGTIDECNTTVNNYLIHKRNKNISSGRPEYGVDIFNACYTKWMRMVLDVTSDRAVVEKCDYFVAERIGVELAQKVLKLFPEFCNVSKIDQLMEALKYTHWFQETVSVSPINEEAGKESVRLSVENCSWQNYWQTSHEEFYPECFKPHGIMLTNFCKIICPTSRVVNLLRPGESYGCAWEISILK